MQIGGGLGDEYMRAPPLNVGGGGGGDKGSGGFFANLLDLLGVNRQVAKGPKEPKGGKSGKGASPTGMVSPTGGAPAFTPMMGAPTTPPTAAPPLVMHLLDDADSAFSTMRPRASQLGILPNALK